jgi:MFS family permease
MLLGARAGQGVFGALMTPSVLATLAVTFQIPAERAKAFGIYGTVMGSSSGIGVLLGGVLTQYLDWRWCMYFNLPIAAVAAAGVVYAVRPVAPVRRRIDVTGAVLATAGLMALVFGFASAETDGWDSAVTITSLALGCLLLIAFLWVQSRVRTPLLPLHVLVHRNRGGSYLAVLSLAIGMFAALFFLTFYLQEVRDWSPVEAGLGFLPLTVGLMAGVRIVTPALTRSSAASLLPLGLLAIAGGLAILGSTGVDSNYWVQIMPVFLLVGLGTGWVMVTANSTAARDAGPDTAVAGAMVMTSQQVGASIGTALLSTIASTSAASYLETRHVAPVEAVVHGFNVASWSASGFLVIAALAVWVILRGGPRVGA